MRTRKHPDEDDDDDSPSGHVESNEFDEEEDNDEIVSHYAKSMQFNNICYPMDNDVILKGQKGFLSMFSTTEGDMHSFKYTTKTPWLLPDKYLESVGSKLQTIANIIRGAKGIVIEVVLCQWQLYANI
jgi:hypothetical protein